MRGEGQQFISEQRERQQRLSSLMGQINSGDMGQAKEAARKIANEFPEFSGTIGQQLAAREKRDKMSPGFKGNKRRKNKRR